MKRTNNGEMKTFMQLLKGCTKIVIPKIQRDYVQGRKDPKGSNLCEEVRINFVDSIKKALIQDTPLVLDYVYGSRDGANIFYPIDGQQRLTTLFLLHWYVAMKEGKLPEIQSELRKFTYEIRDTSKEFCMSLTDIFFDVATTSSIKTEIINSSKYYAAYNEDPTVQAMLVMLEEIHGALKEERSLYSKLDRITFWVLYLEHFGLTDDLFVKMNARGKRLARFDTFKSELESVLDKRIKDNPADTAFVATVDRWKQNIDNEYLDALWSDYKQDYAERNIYRIIMFFTNCMIMTANGKSDDSWETNDKQAPYHGVIEAIGANTHIIEKICNILGNYKHWRDRDPDMKELLLKSDYLRPMKYYIKVRLFGVLYWWATMESSTASAYFDDYYRILCNYIASNREYAISTRQYQSSIDAKNIGGRLSFVKSLVDGFKNESCDFYSYIKASTTYELAFEREKLSYAELDDIIALENCPALRLSIHNVFFDGCIHIAAPELNEITRNSRLSNLALRIILSFSAGVAGKFKTLVFDDTTNQSGRKKLCYESEEDVAFGYCHKFFLRADTSFGDKVMTADSKSSWHLNDLGRAVKQFAKCFHSKYYGQGKSVEMVLQEILQERLQQADFTKTDDILWYIVKYKEFFYEPSSTVFYVLRRKHYDGTPDDENIYDIRRTRDSSLAEPHCNPFYLATQNRLKEQNSTIEISRGVYICGNQIEYKNPCMLNNGWRIRILKGGQWLIQFNGIMPKPAVTSKYHIEGDEVTLENHGEDCIELISSFIMECN